MRQKKHETSDSPPPVIRFKKRLGQRILKDRETLQFIADSCDLTPETTVLEIGAGIGNLTEQLASRAKKVVAVEIDEQYRIFHLRLMIHHQNIDFIYQNIMDMNLGEMPVLKEARDLVIAGNIPFYITTPLIMRIMEEGTAFRRMVLMVQKEVAMRLAASSGHRTTSAITLKVHYFSNATLLKVVPRCNFHPAPRVDSAIILFTPRKETIFDPETRRQFFKLLDAAFSQRRKIILNSLMSAMGGKISKEMVVMCLGEAGIDPCSRAERVPFEQFLALFKVMQKGGWH